MSTLESTLRVAPTPDVALPVDETGSELKRGAVFNTIALLASNLRGVFTFLVARLLGPAALGTFSVAWANIDLISKFAVVGLDNAVTTLIARSQATGDLARSRTLFREPLIDSKSHSSHDDSADHHPVHALDDGEGGEVGPECRVLEQALRLNGGLHCFEPVMSLAPRWKVT